MTLKTSFNLLVLWLFLFLTVAVNGNNQAVAQQDFNNYKTLEAVGSIPGDFTESTSRKISNDKASGRIQLESDSEENKYLESIHGQIDELLLSGSVIYGDEISTYVQSIAAKLLKDEPELLASLRFYTIKSNETNALSTDQGVVFVTTGLITQLSSEAQLAFVLSHEISHYDQHHVQESYEYYKSNSFDRNKIEKLSTHSRENELEADRLGLKRYHAAGYSKSELISAFDVLMYAYLPFDDIKFPRDYFNTGSLYIPEKLFGDKTYEIKAEEDYNDARSSHPNIKKRKDAINDAIKEYANWGSEIYTFGEEQFNYIRNVSRFESLRTNILNGDLSEALYSIFLLEQNNKDSEYLKHMKALIWLTMIQLDTESELTSMLPPSSKYEGESGNLYYMIRKLKDEELFTVGLRIIYDLHQANKDDEFLQVIYDRLIKTLAGQEKFKLERFSSIGFHEAAQQALIKTETADTTIVKPEAVKSKYDKIKSKKVVSSTEVFDTTNFVLYAIPDVIADSVFLEEYNSYKQQADSLVAIEDAFADLTYKEQKQILKEIKKESYEEGVDLHKFILVEPTLDFSTKKSRTALETEVAQQKFREAIADANDEIGLDMTVISHADLETSGTSSFNERNVYISFLEEMAIYGSIELFPVDYYKLQTLTDARGTSNLVFTSANYSFQPNISVLLMVGSAIVFPTFPITLTTYLPAKLISGQHTVIRTIIFDTNKGIPLTFEQELITGKPRKKVVSAYYYQLLNKLKNKPE